MDGVEVDVLHRGSLALKLTLVEIDHVEVFGFEQVEDVEADLETAEILGDAGVDQRGGRGADGVVLEQRGGAEIADTQRAFPAIAGQPGDAGGGDAFDRVGHAVEVRRRVLEARMRVGVGRIEGEPVDRVPESGDFEAVAACRVAGFGNAGVADVDQL